MTAQMRSLATPCKTEWKDTAWQRSREGWEQRSWDGAIAQKNEAGLTNSSNMFDISKNMFIFAPIKNQRITKSDRF